MAKTKDAANKAAATPPAGTRAPQILNGSNILPPHIEIGAGLVVGLGEVVSAAHQDSGLTAEQWNDLPDDDREARLQAKIDELRKAHDVPGTAPKKPDDESDEEDLVPVLFVTARRAGFRRCGRAWPAERVIVQEGEFTEAQLKELLDEPLLDTEVGEWPASSLPAAEA